MKKLVIVAVAMAFVMAAGTAWAQGQLEVGDKAPEFPQPMASTAGEKPGAVKVQLSDFLGKKNIVLAFYVADWTGG
jgi:peroxiredoxin Q/BCP